MYHRLIYEDIPNRNNPKEYLIKETILYGNNVDLLKKQGKLTNKILDKINNIKSYLIQYGTLGSGFDNHPLNMDSQLLSFYGLTDDVSLFDCHIRSDLILFYAVNHEKSEVCLVALGTHVSFKNQSKRTKDNSLLKNATQDSFQEVSNNQSTKRNNILSSIDFAEEYEFIIILHYTDGNIRYCDLKDYLSSLPEFARSSNPQKEFKEAVLEDDTIVWDNIKYNGEPLTITLNQLKSLPADKWMTPQEYKKCCEYWRHRRYHYRLY